MMIGNEKRILTTHAGSLPRPLSLVDLYAKRARGEVIDTEVLVRESDVATHWVLNQQARVGIDIPSNGEQSREAFFLYVQHRMSGFGGRWSRPSGSELNNYPEFSAARKAAIKGMNAVSNFEPPMANAPIVYTGSKENAKEIDLFKTALKPHQNVFTDTFITAPSPGIIATAIKNNYYLNDDEYLDALANAIRTEYKAAIDAGFILQIDAPDLGLERHTLFHDKPLGDFIQFIDKVIVRINKMLEGLPRNRVRLHVCYGNYESPHDKDVPLEYILPSLLEANVGGFLFPFANSRHQHEIKLFKDHKLNTDQYLIVGAIDTLSVFVEHPEVIADRLELAAESLGSATQVMAGTDCGFDTSAGMGRLTSDVVWSKLSALKDGARIASNRLFA
ncbi:cobalamin-independent methionine synthase II family protein [Rhodospirillaceae bacterium]|nr:cobalamin-independent methionine synthase II family protein [Alphaproteobacteria bacterium]MDC1441799.1 cobalamin-independent methionine synthase II family protein [Rhodospirillaceae bacterium]